LLDMGYPSNKIIAGAPLYGRGWICSGPDIHNCKLTGQVNSQNTFAGESGVTFATYYPDMIANVPDCHWDEDAQASWCVNPDTNEMWSYDSVQAIQAKAKYACDMKLAGVGFWDGMSGSSGQPNEAVEMRTLIDSLAACDVPPMVEIRLEVSEFSEILCGGIGTLRPAGSDRHAIGSYERVIIHPPAGCVVTAAQIDGSVVEGSVNVKKVDAEVKVPDKDVIIHVEYHRSETTASHYYRG
jgi:hypothetical protein